MSEGTPRRRVSYGYSVVTHCAAAQYGEYPTLRRALAALRPLRETDEFGRGWEIERVQHVDSITRRYWLWRAGAWRLFGSERWHEWIFHPTSEDLARWA